VCRIHICVADPDPHRSIELWEQDPHQSLKTDPNPDPHQSQISGDVDGGSERSRGWSADQR
jgi:hypothetical protein